MALFQSPPKTPEEIERARPLDLPPDAVLEYDEARWYAEVYRGDDVPQLTVRSVLLGAVLGFLLAFTNLYIGLKTGWGLGVAITASILAYAFWNGLEKAGIAKTPLTILETNCMQSTASSAGYSTGTTMTSAVAALLMITATEANPGGEHLHWIVLATWTLSLAMLGTVIAIPMKRNMINRERLRFPSGVAAAVTLQSLYSKGSEATDKARALLFAALFGAAFPVALDMNLVADAEGGRAPLLPGSTPLFDWLPASSTHVRAGETTTFAPSDWTVVWDNNPVMIAAGAIVGLRVTGWMTVAALVLAFGLGPWGFDQAWTSPAGEVLYATSAPYKAWREIGLWFGVPIMVSSGLITFALQWRTIVRAFSGLLGGAGEDVDPREKEAEVPMSWFVAGTVVSGLSAVVLGTLYFDIPPAYGVLAVLLTFGLSLVAARATGESDITPTGAMGKLMQLTYGVLIPQSATANLMTASITSSAAASSADLLTDLKSGYLLGANPRRQFVAQMMGIIPGTIATVSGFYLLVPDATALLGTADHPPAFPAPSAQAWKAVAEVFKTGIENMHPVHQQMIVAGLITGAVLVALETLLPKNKAWLPSATGVGLGFILPFQYPLSMLTGALLAWGAARMKPEWEKAYLVPIASGIIAGVSIMGVLAAVLNNVVLGGGGGH